MVSWILFNRNFEKQIMPKQTEKLIVLLMIILDVNFRHAKGFWGSKTTANTAMLAFKIIYAHISGIRLPQCSEETMMWKVRLTRYIKVASWGLDELTRYVSRSLREILMSWWSIYIKVPPWGIDELTPYIKVCCGGFDDLVQSDICSSVFLAPFQFFIYQSVIPIRSTSNCSLHWWNQGPMGLSAPMPLMSKMNFFIFHNPEKNTVKPIPIHERF